MRFTGLTLVIVAALSGCGKKKVEQQGGDNVPQVAQTQQSDAPTVESGNGGSATTQVTSTQDEEASKKLRKTKKVKTVSEAARKTVGSEEEETESVTSETSGSEAAETKSVKKRTVSLDEVPVMGMNGFQDSRSVLGREIRLEQIPGEIEALREKLEADIEALEAARDAEIRKERTKALAELARIQEALEKNSLAQDSVTVENIDELDPLIDEELELEDRLGEVRAAYNEKRAELIAECQGAMRALVDDFEHTKDLLTQEQLRFQFMKEDPDM